MRKQLLMLLALLIALPALARDFAYEYEGQKLAYTVLSEEDKTCMTRQGSSGNGGNKISGNLVIPATASDGKDTYTVIAIAGWGFEANNELESVTLPSTIKEIRNSAFGLSSIKSIEIPNSVTSIGNFAFYGCQNLTDIILPPSVTSVGYNVFGQSGLVRYAYPGDLGIEPSLMGVPYPPDDFLMEDGFVFGLDKSVIYFAPVTLAGEYVIPESVSTIWERAFWSCDNLTSVVIPESVTRIGTLAFGNCRNIASIRCEGLAPFAVENAFRGLDKEKCSVVVPTSCFYSYIGSDEWKDFIISTPDGEIKYYTESDTGLRYAYSPESKTATVVSWSGSQGNLIMPRRIVIDVEGSPVFFDVVGISDKAFSGKSMSQIELPKNLLYIGNYAFEKCSNLKKVVLPDKVKTISAYAFSGCSLEEITFNNSLETIGDYAFGVDESGEGNRFVELIFPEGLQSIGASAFRNCKQLEKVAFPNGLHSIGDYAFNACGNIEGDLRFPEGLQSIGDYAFKGCDKIGGDMVFPEGLQTIGQSAFKGLQFTSLSFPGTLREIKSEAFAANKALSAIHFEDTQDLIIRDWAFSTLYSGSYNSLAELNLPEGIVEIESSVFQGSPLVDLTIPSSLRRVGDDAFEYNKMTQLTIPRTIEYFGDISVSDKIIVENGDEEIQLGTLSAKEIYCGRKFSGKNAFDAELLAFDSDIEVFPSYPIASSRLVDLYLNEGLKEIGKDNFKNCSKLGKVVVPPSVEIIGESAFASGGLGEVIIGCGVKTIGDRAFAYNENLREIKITAVNPPAANNNVFSNYTGTLYTVPESVDRYVDYPSCWYRFDNQVSKLALPQKLIVYDKSIDNAKPGEQYSIAAEIRPANALRNIFFKSTNTDIAVVDYNGIVTIKDPSESGIETYSGNTCEILLYSLYEDGPTGVCVINVNSAGVDGVMDDIEGGVNRQNNVYNMQGICVKRNATQEDINALAPGMYIIGGKKVVIR